MKPILVVALIMREKKLAQALKSTGAIYSERTVDDQVLGVWHLPTNQQQNVAPQQKVAKSFSAEELLPPCTTSGYSRRY